MTEAHSPQLVEADPAMVWDALANRLYEIHADMHEDVSEIASIIQDMPPNGRLLDVGCGFGRVVSLIMRHEIGPFQPEQYVGVDCSARMIEKARELSPDYDFRVGRLGSLEEVITEPFDAFLLLRVLADVQRTKVTDALANIRGHLKVGAVGMVQADYGDSSRLLTHEDSPCIPEGTVATCNQYLPEELEDYARAAGFQLQGRFMPCPCHFTLFLKAV